MNFSKPLSSTSRRIYALFLRSLSHLPRQQSVTFDNGLDALQSKIGPIFVINLDRQPSRWTDMLRELDRLIDSQGVPLSNRVVRYSACDAQEVPPELSNGSMVLPFYTLGDQLFVEPQPDAVPDAFDLERPIKMSQAEVAIACSHIGIWKTIAQSSPCYSLVLEDDIRFKRGFDASLIRRGTRWRAPNRPNLDSTSCTFRMRKCATVLQRI